MARTTAIARRPAQQLEPIESDVQIVTTTQLSAIVRAETDSQIETAHAFPRSIARFLEEAESMATVDEQIAAECIYALERKNGDEGKKVIKGPSVRLAEIVASCYGNLRVGARVVSDNGTTLTAQGVAHDLEKNTAYTIEVMRRITNKNGQRYTEDMIATTGNAAVSIALRNAVLRVVPRVYIQRLQEKIESFLAEQQGTGKKLQANAKKALAWFVENGVSEERALRKLGRDSIAHVTAQDIVTLRGFATAIAAGQTTFDDLFPTVADVAPSRLVQQTEEDIDTDTEEGDDDLG